MKLAFRLLLILLPLGGMAQTPQDSLRVLWVGNSYTYYNDMPSTVRQIAATQKVKLSCTRFLKGGERLSGHLKNQKLLDAIAAGGWDYVILQEQSSAPAMPMNWASPASWNWSPRPSLPNSMPTNKKTSNVGIPNRYPVLLTTILTNNRMEPIKRMFSALNIILL